MAVDNIPYPDADNLAYPDKTFYPLRIPVSHWQLRHYISSPEPDHLYYASGHDLYCVNTTSKKRKHICTLPFEARCTASGHGWVCVGGEDEGHFGIVKLDGGAREDDWQRVGSEQQRWREADVKVERIGEEIVNSISIHRLQDEEAHLFDVVAVLTNNDKTVRVYSLPQGLETAVLDLPFAMNHATLSPDGKMLVAVGDFNQAYFFKREMMETPPQIPKPHNRLTSASVEWRLHSVIALHVSSPESSPGYFTTAWSPNGRLCAVGSEGGQITVVAVDVLSDPEYEVEDAIVAVIPSTRADLPTPHPGAVRTLMFAPEPWDLLIWAEDQGRVCIGDLRTGLKSKQVVNLEPQEEGLNKVYFEDLPQSGEASTSSNPVHQSLDEMEANFLRRFRHMHNSSSAVNFATEYIEARRRQRQQRSEATSVRAPINTSGTRTALEDDPQGLTVREQQILESLRTTRQREEARSQGQPARTINYTSASMFAGAGGSGSRLTSPTPNAPESSSGGLPSIRDMLNTGLPPSFSELSRTSAANTRSSYLRADGSRLPRRRASVILSPPSSSTPVSTSGSTIPSAFTTRARPTQEPTPSSSATTAAEAADEDNPWRTIEDAMSLARGPLFETDRSRFTMSPSPVPIPAATAPTNQEAPTAPVSDEAALNRILQHIREDSMPSPSLPTTSTTAAAPRRYHHEQPLAATARDGTAGFARLLHHTRPIPSDFATSPNAPAEVRRSAALTAEGYDAFLRRARVGGSLAAPGLGFSGREVGVRTAGLAMSADGRMLWVATEDGIFEIRINLKGRMFSPAVAPR